MGLKKLKEILSENKRETVFRGWDSEPTNTVSGYVFVSTSKEFAEDYGDNITEYLLDTSNTLS